jgi:peptide deformylase
MCRKILKKALDISQYGCGDDILESHIKAVNIKNLPSSFKADIEALKLTAAQHQVVSLSSNQVRMQHRMFAILNSSLIVPGKWINYERVKSADYRIIVNPILVSESALRLKGFEECPSIQGLRFHIWNPISQNYTYHTPRLDKDAVSLEQKHAELKGFESRIWDHEVRHL